MTSRRQQHPRQPFAGLVAAGILVVIYGSVFGQPSVAQVSPPGFNASTDTAGVRVNITVPGAPLTSTPVSGGGPTAQAQLDSSGGTSAFAAFPDPGDLVLQLPGLAAGLLASGTAGLPSVKLPVALPSYPLSINATSTTPEASAGAGPYSLSANANPSNSSARASGGLEADPLGNTALIKSTTSIATQNDGSVVATATAQVEGLTVGPLTIGQITSTASQTMSADGTVDNKPNLTIAGVRIGSVPLGISATGLQIGPNAVPIPASSTLNSLLASSGIKLSLLTPQSIKGTLIAPAVQITRDIPTGQLGVGTGSGTATMTIGYAAVTLQAGAVNAEAGSTTEPGPAGPSSAVSGAELPSTNPISNGSDLGSASPGVSNPPSLALPSPQGTATRGSLPTSFARLGDFDIRNIYLVFLLAAAGAFIITQLIARKGVRGPWSSGG